MLQYLMLSARLEPILSLPAGEIGAALAAIPENQWFERKSARMAPKDVAVALVAMANAEGGVIVVGIHDGKVEDVDEKRRNALRQAAVDHTQPPVRLRVEEVEAATADGALATLLVLRVDPGEQMHLTVRGECYLRIGDESRRLSAAQQRELAYDRGDASYEATAVALELEDLDQAQMEGFAQRIGSSDVPSMLRARDLVDRRGRLTVAAELLFDERPQREFPSAHVRVLRYGADSRGVGSRMSLEAEADFRVEGSLPRQIAEAAEIIERLMPKWQQLGPKGLFEPTSRLPREAWLEGLVNAVVHRSYSLMGDHIRFEIFPNRIDVTSPGRFPGIVNVERPQEIRRFARNPRIARVCADLGITRELGEGIRRIVDEMRRRGYVDPVYTQSASSVTLTLHAVDAIPPEVLARLTPSASAVLGALREIGEPIGTGALAEMAGITRMTATRALAALQEEGLVTWRGVAKNDPRATWELGEQ